MINVDFADIHLTKTELKLLKKLNRRGTSKYDVSFDSLLEHPNRLAKYVNYRTDQIGCQIPIRDYICITEKGVLYLQYKWDEYFRGKLPVIISIIALIIALFSLLTSALELFHSLQWI